MAFFSTIAPLAGGLLADMFANNTIGLSLKLSGANHMQINLLQLQGWNYFFIIGGLLAMFSLRLLTTVQEEGETHKSAVVVHMRRSLRRRLRKPLARKKALRVVPAPVKRNRWQKPFKKSA